MPSTARVHITAVTDPSDRQHGLWIDGQRVADLPIVQARMPVRDGAGRRRTWQYLLSAAGDETGYLVSPRDLTSGDYADRVGLDVPEDRTIRDAAVTVIRRIAARAPQRELTAGWVDGKLVMPPLDALPQGYLTTKGDQEQAREVWREIGEISCRPGAENLALSLGAAYAAPYPAELSDVRPVSFALVGLGAPRKGKTTNANAAAGWYGAPLQLNPTVSESSIAIADGLAALGVLPFFRDENHSAGWSPAQWKLYWMSALNGSGRRRSSADGSGILRTTRGWWGVQWWSGNLDPRFGATDGVQARVIALSDPHMPDKATAVRVKKLLGRAYGWPIHWQLADHPTPDAFQELADVAYAELLATAAARGALDGSADTVAECLALTIAGADMVGRMLGVPDVRAAAIRAALRVLLTLADTIADQATDFGAALRQDVMDDVQQSPGAWPYRADYELMRREQSSDVQGRISRGDVHGFRWRYGTREVVSMLRKPFAELASNADYATSEALAELRTAKVLITTAGKGFQHEVKINGAPERFYTFCLNDQAGADAPAEGAQDDGAEGAQDDDQATPDAGAQDDQGPADEPTQETAMAEQEPPAELPFAGDQPAPGPATVVRSYEPCARCGRPTLVRRGGVPMHLDPCPTPEVDTAAPAPAAPEPAPAAPKWRGAAPAVQRRTDGKAQRLADDLAALDEGRPLRLLAALEQTHRPMRKIDGQMRNPFWKPELPGVYGKAHVVNSWAWSRQYSGEVAVLDLSGAWIAAASSVDVAHGALEPTGADPFSGRPGIYEVSVYKWTEDLLPNPLGYVPDGQETVWVHAPCVERLTRLAEQGRWPDATVLDSYTSAPVRLRVWTDYLKPIRATAITKYGRDSDQYAAFKEAFGMATSLMLGTETVGQGRQWRCDAQRPDWTHSIQWQASMTIHRWADECRMVAPEYPPVALQNVDELVIPIEALDIVTTTRRPGDLNPLVIDQDGINLGTFKVKSRKVW